MGHWHPAVCALVAGLQSEPRDFEEMMAERGVAVDHTTIHRWTVRFSPLLLERFNRRKRAGTGKWHVDEPYIKVRDRWMYLYRAIDSVRDTVEFWFSERRDLFLAKRFFRKALARHGRPERVVIDGTRPTMPCFYPPSRPSRSARTRCESWNLKPTVPIHALVRPFQRPAYSTDPMPGEPNGGSRKRSAGRPRVTTAERGHLKVVDLTIVVLLAVI